MVRFILFLLVVICTTNALKVMSFNIWLSGNKVNDGLRKVADQIKAVNPDVVALQEAEAGIFSELIGLLGHEWSGVTSCEHLNTGILTRHKILEASENVPCGMNTKIQLRSSGQEISIWSMHLHSGHYGPDAIMQGATTKKEILGGEKTRANDIVQLLRLPKFVQQIKNSDNVPVIVAGDFNTPSDLDYIEEAKDLNDGWAIKWPATKLLRESAGMIDSFREVHPDPKAAPGFTWPVYSVDHDFAEYHKIRKDRIDFIFYRGSLRANKSETYSGRTKVREDETWKDNEYPSDHFALITEFEPFYKYENNPAFFIEREYDIGVYAPVQECHINIID